jgi:hypothetical protein
MIQVELPPYSGPHSLLDLVASEIIFGHKSEAFRRVSQAKPAAAIPVPVDDDKLCRKGNAGYYLQGRCRQ